MMSDDDNKQIQIGDQIFMKTSLNHHIDANMRTLHFTNGDHTYRHNVKEISFILHFIAASLIHFGSKNKLIGGKLHNSDLYQLISGFKTDSYKLSNSTDDEWPLFRDQPIHGDTSQWISAYKSKYLEDIFVKIDCMVNKETVYINRV